VHRRVVQREHDGAGRRVERHLELRARAGEERSGRGRGDLYERGLRGCERGNAARLGRCGLGCERRECGLQLPHLCMCCSHRGRTRPCGPGGCKRTGARRPAQAIRSRPSLQPCGTARSPRDLPHSRALCNDPSFPIPLLAPSSSSSLHNRGAKGNTHAPCRHAGS
jgi:hypothetical protein